MGERALRSYIFHFGKYCLYIVCAWYLAFYPNYIASGIIIQFGGLTLNLIPNFGLTTVHLVI